MSNLDPHRISLGNTVRDAASGFTGVAIYSEHQTNGNVRFALQPKCKDGETDKLPEIIMIDHNSLDKVDDGIAARSVPIREIKFKIGEEVRDKLSNFQGTIRQYTCYMNGCVHYLISEKISKGLFGKDKSTLMEHIVEQELLEKVGENAKVVETRNEIEKVGKATGGPSTRVAHTRGHR